MTLEPVKALATKWSAVFPTVPVTTIMAVAWLESSFHPQAVNDSGGDKARGNAWGLMQMTAKTAATLAPALRSMVNRAVVVTMHDYVDARSLADANINVMFGAYFLSLLMKEFHDPVLAATAYKYGSAGVRSMGVDAAYQTDRAIRFRAAVAEFEG